MKPGTVPILTRARPTPHAARSTQHAVVVQHHHPKSSREKGGRMGKKGPKEGDQRRAEQPRCLWIADVSKLQMRERLQSPTASFLLSPGLDPGLSKQWMGVEWMAMMGR